MRPPKILIYAPAPAGGIAEHVYYQAIALQEEGVEILCLASRSFLAGRLLPFSCKRVLADPVQSDGRRFRRIAATAVRVVWNELLLAREVVRWKPHVVLLDSFREYLSPFWVWPQIGLAKLGWCHFAANLHDPIRDYLLGPAWFHHLSIKLAYVPIEFGIIHQQLPRSGNVPKHVRLIEAPVGLYEIRKESDDIDFRTRWGVRDGHRVFLCFGYLRNNKNLEAVIEALVHFPTTFLVILGSPASGRDHGVSYYKARALDLGLENRTYMAETFIPDAQIGGIFGASDFVVLLYAKSFVSQSGVLNIAASLKKPVLASSGDGPLREAVTKYQLGVFVDSCSQADIQRGIAQLLSFDVEGARWAEYSESASWRTNARAILTAINRDET